MLLLATIATALLVDGYAHNRIGRSRTGTPGASAGITNAGPILDFSAKTPKSVAVPAGQIALTFDDGPDPRWTPQILRVLRKHRVHATFFVVGAKVARHPGLVRAERRAGHELGSHTFTHANLGAASGPRRSAELSLTQVVLAGTTGVSTSLFRLPYSSDPSELTRGDVAAAREAARYGYLLVTATNDAEDWRRPGVPLIVARARPIGDAGAVVLLHDAGGNRAQTVRAVDQLITELQQRGDRFVTVSQLMGLSRAAVDRPVGAAGRVQGVLLLLALAAAHLVTRAITLLLFPVAVLAALRALIVALFAARHARTRTNRAPYEPAVSIIVPAYNEEVGIEATVRSLASSDYAGDVEIIVVDDGSTDATVERARAIALSNVVVVQQANAGKAVALNTGVTHAHHDVIVMVDADTVFEPDTLRELVLPLSEPTIGAVSGNTKVANRHSLLGRWQHIEYVIGFNLDRRMFDTLRCIPTVPGAAGAFRRDALETVGGVSVDTLAEDTDLTMALNRAGWRVVYEERARAWTEAPAGVGPLWRQRYRWSYGTLQAMWKHRGAIREGSRLGRVGIPYLLAFQVLLPLLGPVVDVFTLYGVIFLRPLPVLLFWLGFNVVNMALGAYAFRLDHERLAPLWSLPLQQVVYRQLMYLVVVQAVRSAIGGHQLQWHRVPRHGTAVSPASAAGPSGRTGERPTR